MVGASFCAGAFALMQNLSIDLAQYYVATSRSVYNGLLDMRSGAFTPVTHVFAAFNTLFRSDNALKIDSAAGDPPAIAARTGDKKYVLISNYRRGEGSFTLDIPNAKIAVSILGDGGFTPFREAESSVTLPLSDYTVYFAEASAL